MELEGSAPVSGALSAGQPQVDPAELVTQLYNDMLGRAPDTEGLAAWTNALDNGWSLPELRSAFAHSPEAQGDLAQFYDQVLGRAADDSGMAAWTGALENGASLIGVRSLFAYSQEAATDLTALFRNAEGRLPDMAELAGMQDKLMPFGATLSGVAADLAAKGPTGFTVSTVPDGDLLLEAEESPNAFDFSSWGFGNVTIEEFAPNQDAIRLDHNLAGDFATVQSHISSNGGATVIAFDSSRSLTLEDVAPGSLSSANFHIV